MSWLAKLFEGTADAITGSNQPLTPVKDGPPQPGKVPAPTVDDKYLELAEKAKFSYGKALLKEAAFQRFLAESGLPCYNHDEVHTYLLRKAPFDTNNRRMFPVWVNIAHCDYDAKRYAYNTATGSYESSRTDSSYRKAIPEAVLMTIVKIKNEFPTAEFFVSDYATQKPVDPFLMVRYENVMYIIERWDEPSFRMGKEK